MKRVVLLTNIPVPYRLPIFKHVAARRDYDFTVVFASAAESNRHWKLNELKFPHVILEGTQTLAKADGFNFVHFNTQIWQVLNKLNPDLVILGGLNPIHLHAWLWCVRKKRKFGFFTDGWAHSESTLSGLHKLLRRVLYPKASVMLGPSDKSRLLYQSYGVPKDHIYKSHLCADNSLYAQYNHAFENRSYDVLFAGGFSERKMPAFFVDVCIELKKLKSNLRVCLAGKGPLESMICDTLASHEIDFVHKGFVQPTDLPEIYSTSKVYLFPTHLDAWGVVANEALAAGTPVITTPWSGAADELIVHEQNGFVAFPDKSNWARLVSLLLDSNEIWTQYSQNARESVQEYSFSNAADGIDSAIRYALKIK